MEGRRSNGFPRASPFTSQCFVHVGTIVYSPALAALTILSAGVLRCKIGSELLFEHQEPVNSDVSLSSFVFFVFVHCPVFHDQGQGLASFT